MATTESCFVVEALYVEDAANKRAPFRDKHLERMAKLSDEGALLLAAAYDDMSGSLLVFSVETDEAVRAIVESDIYMREGVWTGFTIRRLNRVVFDG